MCKAVVTYNLIDDKSAVDGPQAVRLDTSSNITTNLIIPFSSKFGKNLFHRLSKLGMWLN